MITGHLFAGAGGGLYADYILGHEPKFAVEWEPYPAAILRQQFPNVRVYEEDARLFDASEWSGRVDSLHAGFPCQDISVAGVGSGIAGERSGLWSEVVRCADAIRPAELFLENSPAIVSRGIDRVLSDLATLGFDAEWCCLPAAGVGAPHRRDRWWLLARRADADDTGQLPDSGAVRQPEIRHNAGGIHKNVADSDSDSGERLKSCKPDTKKWHEPEKRQAGPCSDGDGWWSVEPDLGRVANGVADRINRIKALGNGQVPLQAAMAYILLDRRYA